MTTLASKIAAKAQLSGSFVLRSGKTSDRYFDKYQFESDPTLLLEIAHALSPLVPPGTEVLAGMELGGVPIATMLSHVTGIPAAFVRKQRKAHGTCRLAEGAELAGKRAIFVEDIISTGGQIIESAAMLAEEGISVPAVLCVIDRDSGGAKSLQAAGIQLISLFTQSQLEQG